MQEHNATTMGFAFFAHDLSKIKCPGDSFPSCNFSSFTHICFSTATHKRVVIPKKAITMQSDYILRVNHWENYFPALGELLYPVLITQWAPMVLNETRKFTDTFSTSLLAPVLPMKMKLFFLQY